jgi:hypothetical protein
MDKVRCYICGEILSVDGQDVRYDKKEDKFCHLGCFRQKIINEIDISSVFEKNFLAIDFELDKREKETLMQIRFH